MDFHGKGGHFTVHPQYARFQTSGLHPISKTSGLQNVRLHNVKF